MALEGWYWTVLPTCHFPQSTAAAAQADLIKKQEELEKKAAELDQRELEIQNRTSVGSTNTGGNLPRPRVSHADPTTWSWWTDVILSVCQRKRITGHLFPSSLLWSPASIRTLRRKSLMSTAGSARGCITSGCVRTQNYTSVLYYTIIPSLHIIHLGSQHGGYSLSAGSQDIDLRPQKCFFDPKLGNTCSRIWHNHNTHFDDEGIFMHKITLK